MCHRGTLPLLQHFFPELCGRWQFIVDVRAQWRRKKKKQSVRRLAFFKWNKKRPEFCKSFPFCRKPYKLPLLLMMFGIVFCFWMECNFRRRTKKQEHKQICEMVTMPLPLTFGWIAEKSATRLIWRRSLTSTRPMNPLAAHRWVLPIRTKDKGEKMTNYYVIYKHNDTITERVDLFVRRPIGFIYRKRHFGHILLNSNRSHTAQPFIMCILCIVHIKLPCVLLTC